MLAGEVCSNLNFIGSLEGQGDSGFGTSRINKIPAAPVSEVMVDTVIEVETIVDLGESTVEGAREVGFGAIVILWVVIFLVMDACSDTVVCTAGKFTETADSEADVIRRVVGHFLEVTHAVFACEEPSVAGVGDDLGGVTEVDTEGVGELTTDLIEATPIEAGTLLKAGTELGLAVGSPCEL